MGSAKSSGPPNARPSPAPAWRGPIVLKSPPIKLACPGGAFGVAFPVFLAVEEVTKLVYAEVGEATPENAAAFLDHLVAEFPQKINAVTTDISPIFTDWRATFNEDMAAVRSSPLCGRLPRQPDRPQTDNFAL